MKHFLLKDLLPHVIQRICCPKTTQHNSKNHQ